METREEMETRQQAAVGRRALQAELQARADAEQANADRLLGSGHHVSVPSKTRISAKHEARIRLTNHRRQIERLFVGDFIGREGRQPTTRERKELKAAASKRLTEIVREMRDAQ